MGAIMESIFSVAYLLIAGVLGHLMVSKAGEDKQRRIFGIMTLILGAGDAFHLIPRIYGNLTGTMDEIYAALGFGVLVTSITMTIFYVMLYHYWCGRYSKPLKSPLTVLVYALSIVRIALCLFPQNNWLSAYSPVEWGIYRNIPFVIFGAIMVYLFFVEARKAADTNFKWAWLAVLLSFLFYMPVVLWASINPMIGMLMLPKTVCYVWLVYMGYRDKAVEYADQEQSQEFPV